MFNPPYVETEDEEAREAQTEAERGIEKTWAGGSGGMRVTDRVLQQVKVRGHLPSGHSEGKQHLTVRSQDLLSPRGAFYLVAVPENKPLEIIASMQARGLQGEVSPVLSLSALPGSSQGRSADRAGLGRLGIPTGGPQETSREGALARLALPSRRPSAVDFDGGSFLS